MCAEYDFFSFQTCLYWTFVCYAAQFIIWRQLLPAIFLHTDSFMLACVQPPCAQTLRGRRCCWTSCCGTTWAATSLSRPTNWCPSPPSLTLPPTMSGPAFSTTWVSAGLAHQPLGLLCVLLGLMWLTNNKWACFLYYLGRCRVGWSTTNGPTFCTILVGAQLVDQQWVGLLSVRLG